MKFTPEAFGDNLLFKIEAHGAVFEMACIRSAYSALLVRG